MPNADRQTRRGMAAAALLVLAAVLLRVGPMYIFPRTDPLLRVLCGLLRNVLYLGLYLAWGGSLRRRILQKQLRRCLVAVAWLLVFWSALRTLRYYILSPGRLAEAAGASAAGASAAGWEPQPAKQHSTRASARHSANSFFIFISS